MVQIAGKPFTQLENLNLLDELRIQGVLVTPGSGPGNITEQTTNYNVGVNDVYVAFTGSGLTATLPNIATAIRGVWIDCISGDVTIAGDAPIETPNPLTTGVKGYFVPLSTQWRQAG